MIRLAVVGLGKMGLSHHSMINAHPRVQVAAEKLGQASSLADSPFFSVV